VRSFLELFRPGLELDLVPISDVAGPTGWDADIQALVVSRETVLGGTESKCLSLVSRVHLPCHGYQLMWVTVDKIRNEKGLPPLRSFVIDVISATDVNVNALDTAALRQAKMSSTYIRQWIVDQGLA
jgi:pantetheine-phosphate adenylyltransferase